MSSDIVRWHLRPTLRSFHSSFLYPRWLVCLLIAFLLLGQQGALRYAPSHWSEFDEATGVAFNAAATAEPASAERSQFAQEHAAYLQCTAYAALAAASPVLVALRPAHTRRWYFPCTGFHAGALVFPVAVYSRDPPIRL